MMNGHGRRHVMFGTRPAKTLECLDDLGVDSGAQALFLGGDASRVLGVHEHPSGMICRAIVGTA
jgi:hypothetical protein